jgi:hypothetical protein
MHTYVHTHIHTHSTHAYIRAHTHTHTNMQYLTLLRIIVRTCVPNANLQRLKLGEICTAVHMCVCGYVCRCKYFDVSAGKYKAVNLGPKCTYIHTYVYTLVMQDHMCNLTVRLAEPQCIHTYINTCIRLACKIVRKNLLCNRLSRNAYIHTYIHNYICLLCKIKRKNLLCNRLSRNAYIHTYIHMLVMQDQT